MITSATVSKDLVDYMKSCFPDVELVQTGSTSPGTLTHQWIVTPLHRRTEVLLHLLEKHTDSEGVCDRWEVQFIFLYLYSYSFFKFKFKFWLDRKSNKQLIRI